MPLPESHLPIPSQSGSSLSYLTILCVPGNTIRFFRLEKSLLKQQVVFILLSNTLSVRHASQCALWFEGPRKLRVFCRSESSTVQLL